MPLHPVSTEEIPHRLAERRKGAQVAVPFLQVHCQPFRQKPVSGGRQGMGNFMDQVGLSIPDPMNGHLHSVFTPPEEDQSAGDSELRPDEHVDALHTEKFVFPRRPPGIP